jgi:hypothetical protein
MQVAIKQQNDQWGVVPLEGRFEGRTVALVDAVALSNVRRVGDTLVGALSASWGLTLLSEHIDAKTLNGVMGKSCFNYAGVKSVSIELFNRAKRVIVSKHEMLAA